MASEFDLTALGADDFDPADLEHFEPMPHAAAVTTQWPLQTHGAALEVSRIAPPDFYNMTRVTLACGTQRYADTLLRMAELGDWMAHIELANYFDDARRYIATLPVRMLMVPTLNDHDLYVYGCALYKLGYPDAAAQRWHQSFDPRAAMAFALSSEHSQATKVQLLRKIGPSAEPFLSYIGKDLAALAEHAEHDPRAAVLYAKSDGHDRATAKRLLEPYALSGVEACARLLIRDVGFSLGLLPRLVAAGNQCAAALAASTQSHSKYVREHPVDLLNTFDRDARAAWLDGWLTRIYGPPPFNTHTAAFS